MRRLQMSKLAWLALLSLAATPGLSHARTYALLVGAAKYPQLSEDVRLEGPPNDVMAFADYLRGRGVPAGDITMLADKVSGASDPTHQAILRELDALAAKARPGDFVLLLLAGHGSQQPAGPSSIADEPDGLDEIFLPLDIGTWDGEVAALPNALTDNELGAAIARIRDRGAFVWAIVDACHSATMTRAMSPPQEKARGLAPQALGIDSAVLKAAALRASAGQAATRGRTVAPPAPHLDRPGTGAARGGFVGFFAAQSQQTTPEWAMPRYTTGNKVHGLFSYTLLAALNRHPRATYRQLIEQVMLSYAGQGIPTPTPEYEGDGLDRVAFEGTLGPVIQQWPVDRAANGALVLQAGQLHSMTSGSILAVVAEPAAKDTEVLGYVQVREAGASRATVAPVAYRGQPALDPKDVHWPAYGRAVEIVADYQLRVSAPAQMGNCDAPSSSLVAALDELKASRSIAQRIRWVSASEPAETRLCQIAGTLWFLDATAQVGPDGKPLAPSLDLKVATTGAPQGTLSQLARQIGTSLEKINRVANLSRLAAQGDADLGLETTLTWLPQCVDQGPDCDRRPQVLTATSRPAIRAEDKLRVQVRNSLTQPVDLTILDIDANAAIAPLYPLRDSDSPRVPPGQPVDFTVTVHATPAGTEQLLLIAVPTFPQSPITSLVSLAQDGVANEATRSAGANSLRALLEEAAFGSASSVSLRSSNPNGNAQITLFGWTVLPQVR